MIFTEKKKTIRVMLTTFRDGFQSMFGGKVRIDDVLPAMEVAAKDVGVRHFEFGGGARYQAPYFYCGEDPFETLQKMRNTVGPEPDLQILTRSISGVTLTTQNIEALTLQAKLHKAHGTTWDRNFDFMNDVNLLARTGKPIVDSGMHHQVCVALMGLPFESDMAHTAEFYINVAKRIIDSGLHFDSMCLKDASGTTTPKVVYDSARGIRPLLPEGTPLWFHTHDTASTAVACYMAAIEGGADGVDLANRPLASGTVQPDVRSLAHALKHTGYSLDIDHTKTRLVEEALTEALADYEFNPVVTSADPRVTGFPMPGGAIGPNVHMMVRAGILNRYSEILDEFPVVVKAGGAWTSVTPGSQQYWLQAFNNVLYGRWEKIDPGYGKSVLGYFGRTPLPPDEEVVKKAAEQLKMEPFAGNPLDAAPDSLGPAKQALEERGLPADEKSVFLVASAMVPGKKIELNEGIRLLEGRPRIDLPLKKKEEEPEKEAKPEEKPAPAAQPQAAMPSGPLTTTCTVVEGGTARRFMVIIDSQNSQSAPAPAQGQPAQAAPAAPAAPAAEGTAVYSPFEGDSPLVELEVKQGDDVKKGQVLGAVEAMKANHSFKAPVDGVVEKIHVQLGDDVGAGEPILTIQPR
ncbi:MAG: 2-oxoglutarate carboxylase large subunit [Calditrichaeota bacterium]|nr:2-oxoglutarate carboxylase large subunit [Calditrichota bacterium]